MRPHRLVILMKSYPTSLEFHNMHGPLQLFTKDLYPIERRLLKMFGLHIAGATSLSEMNLDSTKHKVLLHKVRVNILSLPLTTLLLYKLLLTLFVGTSTLSLNYSLSLTQPLSHSLSFFCQLWDLRMNIMAQSQNPMMIEMRPYLRPKGCDELWDLLLKLKALDEMHSLKDMRLYQTNHRDKKSAAAAMAAAYDGMSIGMTEGVLFSSHDLSTGNIHTSATSSSDNNRMIDTFELPNRSCGLGASPNATQHVVSSLPPSSNILSSSSSSSSRNNDIHTIDGYTPSDAMEPHRFTREECNLFNDKLNRCRRQTKNTNNIQWHTMAYIFEEASNQPSQSTTRTIWPRSEERLENWYSNNVRPAQKKQRLDSEQHQVPSTQLPSITSSSSSSSAAGLGGPVNHDNGGTVVVDMLPTERHFRHDDLTTDEVDFVIGTGKDMKMDGQEVNGANLSQAYCRHFLSWKRQPSVLAEKWQRWFRGQKKSKTVWYKEYKAKFPTTRDD